MRDEPAVIMICKSNVTRKDRFDGAGLTLSFRPLLLLLFAGGCCCWRLQKTLANIKDACLAQSTNHFEDVYKLELEVAILFKFNCCQSNPEVGCRQARYYRNSPKP